MKIGFIGAGNMAQALVRGIHSSGNYQPEDILITDRGGGRAEQLAEQLGLTYIADNRQLASRCQVLILAVKPAQILAVLEDVADVLPSGSSVISLAAGTTLASLRAAFETGGGQEVSLVRAMPNVNALVGESITALSRDQVDCAVLDQARQILGCAGQTVVLDEDDFAVFAALGGCSPAWLYTVVDALARAGVKHGLPKSVGVKVAAQAMLGSAKLILDQAESGGDSAQDLVDRVTSPGGTTIAGLLAAQEAGLSTSLVKAVDAAVARDGQISAGK
ncbi:MAG: pyrroline-5-carboxylate reductase [Actinomycetaceae bacterium]|nr:pyrroline-5-carboxylate reductase [Actinomycetaceae bacterium]